MSERYTNEGRRLTEAEISRGAVNPDMHGLLRAQAEAIRLGVAAHHVAAIVRAYLNPPAREGLMTANEDADQFAIETIADVLSMRIGREMADVCAPDVVQALYANGILEDGRDTSPTPVGSVWRVGRKVGRTIYAQLGPEPSDDDPLIGVMDTPELAAAVIAARASIGPDSRQGCIDAVVLAITECVVEQRDNGEDCDDDMPERCEVEHEQPYCVKHEGWMPCPEVWRVRAALDPLFAIGPDSERIRECPRCANEISDVRDVSCDVCAAGLLSQPQPEETP